jgi:hypothetical protein
VAEGPTCGAQVAADRGGNPVVGVAAHCAPERVDLCGHVRSGRS